MKSFLVVWTTAAFGWWLTALWLLFRVSRNKSVPSPAIPRPSVTVFKPLPPVRHESERRILSEAIETFIAELRPDDELVVGLDIAVAPDWQNIIGRWQKNWPTARIHILTREIPRQHANPKIAWMQVLAPVARGQIWLWSDADVFAEPGFLDSIGGRLATGDVNAVTAPYRIHRVCQAREMLDGLFVNLEFLPGALLLQRLDKQDYAYGAATAFHAKTFQRHSDWSKLGAALADDHELGKQLKPVALTRSMVSTVPIAGGWRVAATHYFRWHKTVRWCRPTGYAALLLLLPALGWTGAAVSLHCPPFYLAGLSGVLAGETVVALAACWLVGCRLPLLALPGIWIWSLSRPIIWLLAWLPVPVIWTGQNKVWPGPQQK
jgi:ceramide glucosyltransferase